MIAIECRLMFVAGLVLGTELLLTVDASLIGHIDIMKQLQAEINSPADNC